MASLRSKVIRLAHSKPELRSALLPLLKAGSEKTEQRGFLENVEVVTKIRMENEGFRRLDLKSEIVGDEALKVYIPIKGPNALRSNRKAILSFRFDWLSKDFMVVLRDDLGGWLKYKSIPLNDKFFEQVSPKDVVAIAMKLYRDYDRS